MKFGVHVSVAGGIHLGLKRAAEIGCETAQFFLGNPRGWHSPPLTADEIERFLSVREKEAKDIRPLAAHIPYLPNLASLDEKIRLKSVLTLRDNLERCEALTIDFLVTHLGKSKEPDAEQRMVECIVQAYDDKRYGVCLLLENTAGQGSETGFQLPDLAKLYAMIPNDISKGICLDTCHAFAAGYEIGSKSGFKQVLRELNQTIGFKEVKLLHVNDSLKPLGSRVDRHAQIGAGHIGLEGFRTLFSHPLIRSLPGILEIPRKTIAEDVEQLKLVRSLAAKPCK